VNTLNEIFTAALTSSGVSVVLSSCNPAPESTTRAATSYWSAKNGRQTTGCTHKYNNSVIHQNEHISLMLNLKIVKRLLSCSESAVRDYQLHFRVRQNFQVSNTANVNLFLLEGVGLKQQHNSVSKASQVLSEE
jgi:hypothetical protein